MKTARMTRHAREVYAKAFAAVIAMYLANRLVESHLSSHIHERDFRWAIAFILVQGCVLIGLSTYLLALRAYGHAMRNIRDHIRPPIRDRVLALALEGESWPSNVPKRGPARQVLEESITDALMTLKASGRDRIAHFAVDHGFQLEWSRALGSRSQTERKRVASLLAGISAIGGKDALASALHDEYPAIRAIAYRGLLLLGDPADIDAVFLALINESFLVRSLLVNDLKRRAAYLLSNTIPRFLETASHVEAARCFEILIAWKTALPSLDIRPWTTPDSDHRLWPLVLALVPYVQTNDAVEDFVVSALNSDDEATRCAAADAAGHLKLERSIPLLSVALTKGKQIAVHAANALGQMGSAGQRRLEQIITASDRTAALFAMEALEHATVKAG